MDLRLRLLGGAADSGDGVGSVGSGMADPI
jgi:hypothetical protein